MSIWWTSCLGRFARPSLWCAGTLARRWLWALVWSLGGTLGPAMVMWLLSGSTPAPIASSWSDEETVPTVLKVLYVYPLMAFFCSPLVATAAFSGLATLSATSPLSGQEALHRLAADPEISTVQARRSRWVGAALLATAPVAFSWAHGIDVFPLTARRLQLEPGRSDTADLQLTDLWSTTPLACDTIPILAGVAQASLPPLRHKTSDSLDLKEKSLLFRRDPIQHLFLVRAR
jgi:hypothetical protein